MADPAPQNSDARSPWGWIVAILLIVVVAFAIWLITQGGAEKGDIDINVNVPAPRESDGSSGGGSGGGSGSGSGSNTSGGTGTAP